MSWRKTIALALEMPFDTEKEDLWEKLIHTHPKFTAFFLNALGTIELKDIQKIGVSMLKWYNKKDSIDERRFEAVQQSFTEELAKRVVQEYEVLPEEEQEGTKTFLQEYIDHLGKHTDTMQGLEWCQSHLRQTIETLELGTEEGNNKEES